MKRFIIIFLVLIFVAAAFVFFISKSKSKIKSFKTYPVKSGEVTETAIAIGQIVPRQDISIKSKIRGILKKKYVEVGDKVDVGDPLMEVNPDPTPVEFMQAKRKMEIAKVALDNAEVECDRAKKLRAKKWVSQQDYDDAKQLLDEAKLRFEMARENFDLISKGTIQLAGKNIDNIIRSPIKGTVLELLVDVGDPVVPLTTYQAGTPLMTVADMTDLIFKGTVDEIDVGKIREGIPAKITAGALPDKRITGIVSEISPKAKREANATLFNIEIEFSSTNTIFLRAGYSATAKIIIAQTNNVLVVPERLIFYSNDVSYVEICLDKKKQKFENKKITTGSSVGITAEIKSGLSKEDLVVERLKKEW